MGIHAVRALEAHYEMPPGLEIVDGGTSGLDLLALHRGPRPGALRGRGEFPARSPATSASWKTRRFPALFGAKDSLHHLGLMDVLAAAQLLDVAPREICLIGIQPHTIEIGLELSGIIQAKLGALVDQVITRLRDWGLTVRPLPGKREG